VSVLTGHRTTEYRWDLLTLADATVGTLDGVEGARLEWSVAREIRGTGSMQWAGLTIPDWTQVRLQPWVTITARVTPACLSSATVRSAFSRVSRDVFSSHLSVTP
jgi:hypothetical protein